MKRTIGSAAVAVLFALGAWSTTTCIGSTAEAVMTRVPAAPVIDWSHEARRAIVPAGPGGIFGPENYGNKFPGEAAIYMGIVHAAMYDAAVAIAGGYRPYALPLPAPAETSAEAAIATAAHGVLAGLQPALGLTPAQQATLDGRYDSYLARIPDGLAKANGISVGGQAASAVLALRANDGRERSPQIEDLDPPAPGPGVWSPGSAPAVGLRVPGIRPLALESASQFRPDGPSLLASLEYADEFQQLIDIGGVDSDRTAEQTLTALFWTDHDLRQWNDGMLELAAARELDLVQAARMLAMAHVAGGDAMLACSTPSTRTGSGGHSRPSRSRTRMETPRPKPTRHGRRSRSHRTSPSIRRRTHATPRPSPKRCARSSAPTASASRSTVASRGGRASTIACGRWSARSTTRVS
jgi:hypothetical protein